MKVYIIGDRGKAEEFEAAEHLLKQRGYAPVNPLKVIQALPSEINNSDFTLIAFEIIRVCDAVYLLEGWDKNLFARMEAAQAEREQKTLFDYKGGNLN